MVLFSYPLVPAALALLCIHFSDRFLVQKFCGLEDLGIYSLGYKFGMIISVIVAQPFFRIWNTQRFEIAKQQNSKKVLSGFFTYFLLLVVTVGLFISIFSEEVIAIMAPAKYAGAGKLISLIILSYIFSGMATFFTLGTMIVYKTKYTAYINVIAAVLNILLNLVLIPRWGIMGAAWSTVATFFFLFSVTMVNSQRLYPIDLELRRIASLFFAAGVVFGAGLLVHQDFLVSIAIKGALFLLFPGVLWMLGFFYPEEIAKGKELVSMVKNRVLHLSPSSAKS
jgi:O-antigen/teichoic acid export membrane protein